MSDGIVEGDRAGYFSVGGVLGRSFSLFGGEIGKYLLLGALLMSPTLIYSLFFQPAAVVGTPVNFLSTIRQGAALGFASFVLQVLLQATVLYGAFQQMQGKSFDLGESLKVGFGRIVALLGVTFLVGLAAGLGALLLVVPGIMVFCAYYVAVPVCVIERPGIFESLQRSGQLTKGSRWKIFGLILAVFAIGLVVGGLIMVIGLWAGGPKVGLVSKYVWQAISSSFGAVMIAVVYHDLRTSKDGVSVDQIASVFD